MDANKGIPVTVSQVEPETEYEGTVFDQTVIVGLPDGSEMGLFGKDVLVSDDMVGKQKRILVSTLTNNPYVEQTTDKTKGVYPNSENPLSWDDPVYSGSVDQIMRSDDNHYKILLDVGIGEIIVRPSKEQFPNPEVGNFLHVNAIRSDVYDVGNSAWMKFLCDLDWNNTDSKTKLGGVPRYLEVETAYRGIVYEQTAVLETEHEIVE